MTKTGLVGIGLDGSHLWTHAATLDARPAIAGDVVVYSNGGALVALDGTTGKELWHTSVGSKRLRGAGDDGSITVASLGSESGGGTLLVAVNRSGGVMRNWSPQPDVGIPAIAGGTVFAPWGSQYVSALDVSDGAESGRVLARTVVSRAVAVGGSLYFGENAFVRFDPAIAKAAENEAHIVKLPERELRENPSGFAMARRSCRRRQARPTAFGSTRALPKWAAISSSTPERFAATYFRIAVGFNGVDGALRWVRTLPAEVIGGDATAGGFAFCDTEGNILLTDARAGGDAGHVSFGQPVSGCVVNGGSFHVPAGNGLGYAHGTDLDGRQPARHRNGDDPALPLA